jgi:phage tail tape-measure protein
MVASAAGGRTVGRVLAPAMARIVRQNLARLAARTTTQLASRAGTTAAGASAGSAVPVVGSAVGAAIGFAAGAALDYMGNRVDKWLHREEFIAENLEAVSMIETEWRTDLERELHRTIDAWFDDAKVLLEELRPETG